MDQVVIIKVAWPKSGWEINKVTIIVIIKKEINLPGGPVFSKLPEINQAEK